MYHILVSKFVHKSKWLIMYLESYHKSHAVKCTWTSELVPLGLSSKVQPCSCSLFNMCEISQYHSWTLCLLFSEWKLQVVSVWKLSIWTFNGITERLCWMFCLRSQVTEHNSPSFSSNKNGFRRVCLCLFCVSFLCVNTFWLALAC